MIGRAAEAYVFGLGQRARIARLAAWSRELDETGSVTFYRSRWRVLCFVGLALLMGAGSAWMLADGRRTIVGWVGLALCVGAVLQTLLPDHGQPDAEFRVTNSGIETFGKHPATIPWDAIVRFLTQSAAGIILIDLTPEGFDAVSSQMWPDGWQHRVVPWTKEFGPRRIAIMRNTFGGSHDDIALWLESELVRARERQSAGPERDAVHEHLGEDRGHGVGP